MQQQSVSAAEIYARQGIGQRIGFGTRPALLLVDFTNGFNEPGILGGGNIQEAIDRSAGLLGKARHVGIPIVHTRISTPPTRVMRESSVERCRPSSVRQNSE